MDLRYRKVIRRPSSLALRDGHIVQNSWRFWKTCSVRVAKTHIDTKHGASKRNIYTVKSCVSYRSIFKTVKMFLARLLNQTRVTSQVFLDVNVFLFLHVPSGTNPFFNCLSYVIVVPVAETSPTLLRNVVDWETMTNQILEFWILSILRYPQPFRRSLVKQRLVQDLGIGSVKRQPTDPWRLKLASARKARGDWSTMATWKKKCGQNPWVLVCFCDAFLWFAWLGAKMAKFMPPHWYFWQVYCLQLRRHDTCAAQMAPWDGRWVVKQKLLRMPWLLHLLPVHSSSYKHVSPGLHDRI